jgi:3-deoxy-7-phosphoheptulonate synthase
MNWSPESWKQKVARQQPSYGCGKKLEEVKRNLSSWPGLVSVSEIKVLKQHLALAADGQAFLLQGGDCAERFRDCTPEIILTKLQILKQMSLIIGWGLEKPVIKVGRIAGQYGKPRSKDFEVWGPQEIPVYRGDAINDFLPTAEARTHDPGRLGLAYQFSSMTLNFMRSISKQGFTDLLQTKSPPLVQSVHPLIASAYQKTMDDIKGALGFVESMGVNAVALSNLEFFTSHEGLLLDYEEALTRRSHGSWYDLSSHMLWIGERTRSLDEAHVEFFRGVENPIGIKIGPDFSSSEIVKMLDQLNPHHESGKIILITRFGAEKAEDIGNLAGQVKASGHQVVWSCDPMHGNSEMSHSGKKTRDVSKVLSELQTTTWALKDQQLSLGGVHFELTSDDVTECIGGLGNLGHEDLNLRYETWCDPRLNQAQALEMAFKLVEVLGGKTHLDTSFSKHDLKGSDGAPPKEFFLA